MKRSFFDRGKDDEASASARADRRGFSAGTNARGRPVGSNRLLRDLHLRRTEARSKGKGERAKRADDLSFHLLPFAFYLPCALHIRHCCRPAQIPVFQQAPDGRRRRIRAPQQPASRNRTRVGIRAECERMDPERGFRVSGETQGSGMKGNPHCGETVPDSSGPGERGAWKWFHTARTARFDMPCT